MAVYRERHEDELKTCPYNSNHRVATRRYQIHIAACAAKTGPGWVVCPFDQSHRLQTSELKGHLLECEANRQRIREIQERKEIAMREQSGGATVFKSLPVIGMSDPANARDPWAEEGAADNQPTFRIKGLGDDFDAEDFVNNPDPTAHVDPICLQRLTAAQRKTLYANRNAALAKLHADQEREARAQQQQPQPPVSSPSVSESSGPTSAGASNGAANVIRKSPYTIRGFGPASDSDFKPVNIGTFGRGRSFASAAAAAADPRPGA